MPVQRVGPDSNGLFYNAIGTAAWQGEEGAQLRAEGWTYCGYGTWGVLVAAPGESCGGSAGGGGGDGGGGGPMILPPVATDTGSSSSSGGCGCGGRGGMMPGGRPAAAAAPAAGTVVAVRDEFEGIPTWIWWVLVVLALIVLLRG